MTRDLQRPSNPDGDGGSSDGDGLPGGVAPLGAIRPPSPSVIEHARMDLAQRIAGEASGRRPHRQPGQPGQPGQSPSRRVVLASAAAVLLTGGALGTYLERNRARTPAKPVTPAVEPTPAAQTLADLVQQVRSQPDTWRDSPFWYARSIEPSHPPGGEYGLMQNWTGHEKSYWLDNRTNTARSTPVPRGDTKFSLAVVGGEPITWDGLFDVPTDPVALAALLRTQNQNLGSDQDTALYYASTRLLGSGPLPSGMRAALIQIFASLERATVVGPVTDLLGRAGFAIRHHHPDVEHVFGGWDYLYIFDPVTGFVNETRDLKADPHFSTINVVQGSVASLSDTLPVPANAATAIAALNKGKNKR